MVLILSISVATSFPTVQTYLANYAMGFLKSSYDVNISIERLKYNWPNELAMEGVYLEDHTNDTIAYLEDLKAGVFGFDMTNNHLMLTHIHWQGGKFYLRKHPQDSVFAFYDFIMSFDDGSPVDTTAQPFSMSVDKIEIRDITFEKNRIGCLDTCTQIFLKNAGVVVKSFELFDGYVTGDIRDMFFIDEDRFQLFTLQAKAGYKSNNILAEDLYFKTTQSELTGSAILTYNDGDFSDFIKKVDLDVHFTESLLSSAEFRSYLPEFPDFGNFQFSGNGKGTLDDFEATNIDFRNLDNTRLFGNAHVTQCTNVDSIVVDAQVGIFKTNDKEISANLNQFLSEPINDEIAVFGNVDLRGEFEWSMNHFLMDGEVSTAVGNGYANVALNHTQSAKDMTYKGSVDFSNLNLGKLLKEDELGLTTIKGHIDGKGATVDDMDMMVALDVKKLDYHGYKYTNIDLKGEIEKSAFNGLVKIKDPNIDFDFVGNVDLANDTSKLDFKADLKRADLYKLQLWDDTTSVVSGLVDIDFDFFEDSWWDGKIAVEKITYESDDRFFFFEEIVLNSTHSNQSQNIDLRSKIVEGNLKGKFKVLDLFNSVPYILEKGIPTYTYLKKEKPVVVAEANFNFNNTEILSTLLHEDFFIEPNTQFTAKINTDHHELSAQLTTDGISYKDLGLYSSQVNLLQKRESFFLDFTSDRFKANQEIIDSVVIKADAISGMAKINAKGIYLDSINSNINLVALGRINDDNSIGFDLKGTTFNYGDTYFDLGDSSNLVVDSIGAIFFHHFVLESSRDYLTLNGELSTRDSSELSLKVDSLSFAPLNYLVGSKSSKLSGTLTGNVTTYDILNHPKIVGDLHIDTLYFNDRNQGHIDFTSVWNPEKRWLDVNLSSTIKDLNTLDFSGYINTDSTLALHLDGRLNRQRIGAFNSFFEGILSNMRGMAMGEVEVNGTLRQPIVSGGLTLNKVGFTVPFLNTDYSFEGKQKVEFLKDEVKITPFEVRNTKDQSRGSFMGSLRHKNFNDLELDFHVKATNLLALDTKLEDNPYFYGEVKATGDVDIVGPIDDIELTIKAKTEEGTNFKIPLGGPKEISQFEYITFVDYSTFLPQDLDLVKAPTLNGLTINIDVEVTPKAQVELIMDETVGDKISGSAEGNLRMKIFPGGEITLFGNLAIVKGNYLFTLQNILNKPFDVVPGGTISWSGDPFDAQVSLDALYVTKASLKDYLTTESNKKYPINLYLDLEGNLMNPNITFDIEIPTANAALQDELANRLSTQDNMNRQAFSLLILNSFFTDNISSSEYVSNSVTSNTSQALFTQLSNFLAQGLGKYVDIQLGYNPGTGANPNTGTFNNEEVEIGISKTFFDDKVTFNTVVDVPVGSNPNTVAGDVEVEYQITEKVRTKAFNRSNQDNPALDKLSPYSQGVGVLYRTDFNTYSELMDILFGSGKNEEEKREVPPENKEEKTDDPPSESPANTKKPE